MHLHCFSGSARSESEFKYPSFTNIQSLLWDESRIWSYIQCWRETRIFSKNIRMRNGRRHIHKDRAVEIPSFANGGVAEQFQKQYKTFKICLGKLQTNHCSIRILTSLHRQLAMDPKIWTTARKRKIKWVVHHPFVKNCVMPWSKSFVTLPLGSAFPESTLWNWQTLRRTDCSLFPSWQRRIFVWQKTVYI